MVVHCWESLIETAGALSPLLHGAVRNFLIQIEGAAVVQGQTVLVRAFVQGSADSQPPQRVVLKVRNSDWQAVRHCDGKLKAIQATFLNESPFPLLDVSGPESVLISTLRLDQGELIQVAEVFSGGFAGWKQAITVLYKTSVPIHTAWTLDWDPKVTKYLQTQDPSLKVVKNIDDFEELGPDDQFHLQADAFDLWWLRAYARRPATIITVSAPCPSWSAAAGARGLQTREGNLLLQLAGICGAIEAPLVLLEQVGNFSRHSDFQLVSEAWERAGYVRRWYNTLDLQDFLPVSRARYLAVLQHRRCESSLLQIPGEAWTCTKRMNLAEADAILPHPQPLHKSLILSQDLLDKYLDPCLIPSSRSRGRSQHPASFRIRQSDGVATCFMARYGSQHLLPQELLASKGLMGCLFSDEHCVRFFSPPEISILHGMQATLWVDQDSSLNYQVAGNAIAVPHALATLAIALKALGVPTGRSVASTVALAHEGRLKASNTAFLPVDEGWILCRHDVLRDRLLAALPRMSFNTRLQDPSSRELTLESPTGTLTVRVDRHVSLQTVSAHLGLHLLAEPEIAAASVQVSSLPAITAGAMHANAASNGMFSAVSETGLSVASTSTALTCMHVLEACQHEVAPGWTCALYGVEGTRVDDVLVPPPICLIVPEQIGQPLIDFALTTAQIPEMVIERFNEGFGWEVSAEVSDLVRLTFPAQLLRPLGWRAVFLRLAPLQQGPIYRQAPMAIEIRPSVAQPLMPPSELHQLQALWLFRAQLCNCGLAKFGLSVEVQVVHQPVWRGSLLGSVTLGEVERMWNAAFLACALPEACRVHTGPFAYAPDVPIARLHSSERRVYRSRCSGRLVLTVHPELRGGGAKVDTKAWAATKVATVCLAQGMPLTAAPAFAEQLVAQCANKKLEQALHAKGDSQA